MNKEIMLSGSMYVDIAALHQIYHRFSFFTSLFDEESHVAPYSRIMGFRGRCSVDFDY